MAVHKPKILMLDLVESSAKAMLGVEGITALVGSFGSPYKVPLGSGPCVVDTTSARLPEHQEADGYVVDLRELPSLPGQRIQRPPDNVHRTFTSGVNGRVDPRPYVMSIVKGDVDRVLAHGALCIVFVQPREIIDYVNGHLEYGGSSLRQASQASESNYSFSSTLFDGLVIESDHGKEMTALAKSTQLGHLLSKHLDGGSFTCTLSDRFDRNLWTPLARNKFGACVAAAAVPNQAGGIVILLPTLNDEPAFLVDLFKEILPEMYPKLFPELNKGRWALTPPYELETVIQLQKEAHKIAEAAANEVANIEEKIKAERLNNDYLFELTRGTGTSLVDAVKVALATLGFKDVLDVDEQMKAAQPESGLREDLQIRDKSPLLTVDIKGLTNFPTDSDALQAHKHAAMRMQEEKRFDIQALAIINHQRNVPPLDRGNDLPLREELLKVAAEVKMGMLTSWDLHRLVRNTKRWGWKSEEVMPVLYRTGRIEPIPEHYSFLGTVAHFYEKPRVASIKLTQGVLKRGGRIAFDLPVEFNELQVDSLQVDHEDVEQAAIGSTCGVVTTFDRADLPVGTRVYLVRLGK